MCEALGMEAMQQAQDAAIGRPSVRRAFLRGSVDENAGGAEV
jgi:hypothetical protein